MKFDLHYLALSVSAFVLGLFATGFGWVIYLIIFDQLPRSAEVFVEEPYEPADIVIDFDSGVGSIPQAWGAFAQGGEEAGIAMLKGTTAQMKQLEPAYVRLDHIFDDDYYDVVSGTSGNLSVNWSRLDATVDHILAMGAKPFFSLGYMPRSLAETKISAPYAWGDWQWLVQRTIEHYSGTKNIENVYYEVWNEPDLESFGSWKYYGDKSYITLYDTAARGALALRNAGSVQPFKFGGPAITALYKNWVLALIKHTQAQGLPLDFISWHRYSYNPAQFAQDVAEVESWAGPKAYEWIISEWGPDSYKTSAYAGQLAAAHAVATMRKTLGQLTWAFAFEVKDGPGQGNLGWGVLTHDGAGLKPKPRYYAFNYLKEMATGSQLLLSGEGSSVTGWAVGDRTQATALITNYAPTGSVEETVPVRFVNISPGQYQLSWESLMGERGEELIAIEKQRESIAKSFVLRVNEVLKIRLTLLEPFAKLDPLYESVGNTGFGRIILKDLGIELPPEATDSASLDMQKDATASAELDASQTATPSAELWP